MTQILVVEDESVMNTYMSLALRLEGHEVLQAHDGAQALQMLKENDVDLILSDMQMPIMGGLELARRVRDIPHAQTTPLIFVTGRDELEFRVQGLEYAVDYIVKPFATPELLARVRSALRLYDLEKELRAANAQLALANEHLASANEQLKTLVLTDELTQICNRRGFDKWLEDELWRMHRQATPMALLIFDLDRFKLVNDTWGHVQGDEVLREFARMLRNSSRHIDIVSRFGGEEFAVVLPDTNLEGARIFAEKAREALEKANITRGDAKCHDVGELLEADVLALHLAPDRQRRLLAAGDLGLDPGLAQVGRQAGDDAVDAVVVVLAQLLQAVEDRGTRVWPKLGKGKVFEFDLQLFHADALGQGRVDLHRLGSDAAALVGIGDEMQRAHVVQAVGKLDEKHPDVFRHCQEQFSEVLGLCRLGVLQVDLVELGDAVDKLRHDGAEEPADLGERDARILHRVVEEASGDGGAVELKGGQDACYLDRVVEVGVARGTKLRPVRLHSEDVGAVQKIFVGVRVVTPHALDQFVLAHNATARRGAGLGGRRRLDGQRQSRQRLFKPHRTRQGS